jgi:hypothetical protein
MARDSKLSDFFKDLVRRGSRTGRPGSDAPRRRAPAPAPAPAPRSDGGRAGPPRNRPIDRHAVRIEYSPQIDGDPDPGEVVWTWVPFEEDPTQGKDRPVVVIGRRGDLLTGVPLTSKAHDDEPQVAVGTGAWDPERRPSFARITRLLDIEPDSVRREGAVLDLDRFADVVRAVRGHYDIAG